MIAGYEHACAWGKLGRNLSEAMIQAHMEMGSSREELPMPRSLDPGC